MMYVLVRREHLLAGPVDEEEEPVEIHYHRESQNATNCTLDHLVSRDRHHWPTATIPHEDGTFCWPTILALLEHLHLLHLRRRRTE